MRIKPNQFRKNIRLEIFDYGSSGAYFVPIVTYHRESLFGIIENEVMILNPSGDVVNTCWLEIPTHFPETSLGSFVIMPNHLHGIIIINDPVVGASHEVSRNRRHASPLRKNKFIWGNTTSLGVIIGSFKSAVTKCLHQSNLVTQRFIWQRNYFDHVIRNDDDYQRIVDYIELNPSNWEQDEEFVPEE